MKTKGWIFNIQRFSLDDGPGIRTVVFLKGCPLKCLWCSNPESQNPMPELGHRETLCAKCGRCINVCPRGAITLQDRVWKVNRKLCDVCGMCVEACLRGALGIWGKEVQVEQVVDEVAKDLDFYKASNGGVTASGGEPLYQHEFTAALFEYCQNKGIHTTLETSGYATRTAWLEVLKYTDLVLYDVKCADSELHLKLTGVSNELILDNLKFVKKSGVPIIARIPIIPSLNDSEREIHAKARVITNVGIDEVELLPYHRYGLGKYKMLGLRYEIEDLKPPTSERLRYIKELFEAHDVTCKIVK